MRRLGPGRAGPQGLARGEDRGQGLGCDLSRPHREPPHANGWRVQHLEDTGGHGGRDPDELLWTPLPRAARAGAGDDAARTISNNGGRDRGDGPDGDRRDRLGYQARRGAHAVVYQAAGAGRDAVWRSGVVRASCSSGLIGQRARHGVGPVINRHETSKRPATRTCPACRFRTRGSLLAHGTERGASFCSCPMPYALVLLVHDPGVSSRRLGRGNSRYLETACSQLRARAEGWLARWLTGWAVPATLLAMPVSELINN